MAAVVALHIANRDKKRRWREADARAGVAYSRLLVPLREWTGAFSNFGWNAGNPSAEDLLECIDRKVLHCPVSVLQATGDMRDLGPATEPMIQLLMRAQAAVALEDGVRSHLKMMGESGEIELIHEYKWNLRMAARAGLKAQEFMRDRLNRTTWETRWLTSYSHEMIERSKAAGLEVPRSLIERFLPRVLGAPVSWLLRRQFERRPFRGD